MRTGAAWTSALRPSPARSEFSTERGHVPAIDECSWGRAADLNWHRGCDRHWRGPRTRARFRRVVWPCTPTTLHRRSVDTPPKSPSAAASICALCRSRPRRSGLCGRTTDPGLASAVAQNGVGAVLPEQLAVALANSASPGASYVTTRPWTQPRARGDLAEDLGRIRDCCITPIPNTAL
jgi:hypothetical protein